MIDTESVACESCTAHAPGVLDASDAASRAWPRIDIATNPFKAAIPAVRPASGHRLFGQRRHRAAPRCVLEAQRLSTRP